MRSCRGFTLGEMMLVVAIISLLASIFEPKIAGQFTMAREASVLGNLGAIRGAVQIYYANTEGYFPNDLSIGLTTNGTYMSSIPAISVPEVDIQNNPGFNSTNQIIYGDGAASPAIGTLGPGGVEGGYYFINSSRFAGSTLVNWPYNRTNGSMWTLQ